MALCERLIDQCISVDCDNAIYTGVDSTAYIFNKSEIASFTAVTDEPNLISGIEMKETSTTGTYYTGYKIIQNGKTPFTGTNTAFVEGNTGNKFTNTFSFIVPDNSPKAAKLIDNLANGKFVVVIKNDYAGSDGKGSYQVYGMKKGLVATATDNDKYSEDTDGGWQITMTEEKTPVSAMFLRHMSDDTTPVDDTADYLESLVDCN